MRARASTTSWRCGERHVQEIAGPVLAHRLAIDPQARFAGRTTDAIVEEIVKTVPVPA